MKKLLLTLSLLMVLSVLAQAQNFTATINSVISTAVNGTPTLAPFSTDAEIENGLVTAPVTFELKTNRLWKLMTSISDITWTAVANGPATNDAPLTPANISFGTINGSNGTVSTFIPFVAATPKTTTAVQAKTGPRGAAAVVGNTFTLQYKVTPGFLVDPGTYAVTVVNTISAQ